MAELTRDEIFAECEKRWPDFESQEHHGRSLGFEQGGLWVLDLPIEEKASADAEAAFDRILGQPLSDDEAENIVNAWRREGFFAGADWAWGRRSDG